MKVLACADMHGQLAAFQAISAKVKRHTPHAIICCGDITIFSHEIPKWSKKLNDLSIPVYLIHGNHESFEELTNATQPFKNIHIIHKHIVPLGSVQLVGFGGGGFSQRDSELEQYAKQHKSKLQRPTILVTHAPPYKTQLDNLHGQHVGLKSIRRVIKMGNIILNLAGHIHENFLTQDTIGTTKCLNPGPLGIMLTITPKNVSIYKE